MKFAIDHDLHLHSQLSSCSRHPKQTAETLLRYAKENGLRHLCLTDHFWDDTIPGANNFYRRQNYPHVTRALPLPTDSDVTFDFGCETDFDKHMTLGISRKILEKFRFVIVPTSHLHMTGFTIEPDENGIKERAELYMRRNHALLDMDLPFAKMGLAHFTCGLLDRNCEGSRDDLINAISDDAFEKFFARLAASGMGLELNLPLADCTNEAVLRPYRIARACGCKFYLGSDAHTPDGLKEAMARFTAIVDALELTEDDKFTFA